jgi:hypothetical protein
MFPHQPSPHRRHHDRHSRGYRLAEGDQPTVFGRINRQIVSFQLTAKYERFPSAPEPDPAKADYETGQDDSEEDILHLMTPVIDEPSSEI